MSERPDDICARPEELPSLPTTPHTPPLFTTSVWRCASTEQAEALLGGEQSGYVYQRDAHPNADLLARKCRDLHHAQQVAITASGMSALSLAFLSFLRPGDHIVVSNQLYGRSLQLFTTEARRWGLDSTTVNPTDLQSVASARTARTRLMVLETLANPRLLVADLSAWAELAQACQAQLLVDNTFATPILCQPLRWGAHLVMESITKLMNGHGDVILGMLGSREGSWEPVQNALRTWGLSSAPFDCWLALRGLSTLHLRVERASGNALRAAEFLSAQPHVLGVDYPGLSQHPQHALAARQLSGGFGAMVTFHLRGGRREVDRFMTAAQRILFCPSLGEIATTISHPASTSHRGLTEAQRAELGIHEGTLRLSVGVESPEHVREALREGLQGLS